MVVVELDRLPYAGIEIMTDRKSLAQANEDLRTRRAEAAKHRKAERNRGKQQAISFSPGNSQEVVVDDFRSYAQHLPSKTQVNPVGGP